jgi:hypothetical protein
MTGTRRTHVTILTHEGAEHWEQTMAGMLTQFFLDNNNINTAVSTYIINNRLQDDEGLELENVKVLDDGFYSKQICTLPHFVHLNRVCDPDFQFPVLFVRTNERIPRGAGMSYFQRTGRSSPSPCHSSH